MPRKVWQDGMELIQSDLSVISAALEIEMYDRIIYELMNRQRGSIMFGDSFVVSNVNATTSQVNLGNGLYYDSSQTDPEPKTRGLYLSATANVTHSAADPTHDRIDVVYMTPARNTTSTQTRNFKDANSGVVSAQSLVVETDWAPTTAIVAGTPAISPVAPSVPTGSIALAQVVVSASSGIAGAGAYTDKRTRYQKAMGWENSVNKSASFATDLDTDVYYINASGGAVTVTLPLASTCGGKKWTFVKIDSSGNTITLSGDTISDASTQVISVQFSSITIRSSASQYFMT